MWLLIAFIAVPLIEITLFIQVGGAIGLWPTLLVVVLTAILGTYLVRHQGLATIAQLRSRIETLNDPTDAIAHGAMILFSGALLLTPGFFTDAVGFALLIPGLRVRIIAEARKRIKVQSFGAGFPGQARDHTGDGVIDGEFTEIREEPRKSQGPSGWTRDN